MIASSPARHRLHSIVLAVAASALLGGCQTLSDWGSAMAAWTPGFLQPYRPDVHQGNIITKEMVDQLRIGMTREQVRFMLGTPLMTSELHKNRVDYIYYLNPRKGPVQNRRVTLYFADGKLARFVSDDMPNEELADILILGPNAKRAPAKGPAQPQTPQTMPDVMTPPPGATD